jgi:hypothetical protein
VAFEPGIDEASRRVDEQPETSQRRLALQPGHNVDSEPDSLQRRSEDEFSGVEHERLFFGHFDQLGQVCLRGPRIDLRVAVIHKDPEAVAHPEVHRGWLNEARLVRLDGDLA